jgi:hypothetical protein
MGQTGSWEVSADLDNGSVGGIDGVGHTVERVFDKGRAGSRALRIRSVQSPPEDPKTRQQFVTKLSGTFTASQKRKSKTGKGIQLSDLIILN